MKNIKQKIISFSVLAFIISSYNIFAAPFVPKEPTPSETIHMPVAELVPNPTDVYYAEKDRKKSRRETGNISGIQHPTMESYLADKENDDISFLKNTYNKTIVTGDFEFLVDPNKEKDTDKDKWFLFIRDVEGGKTPFFARGGFYIVNGKTYYLDNDGHVVTGLAKDMYGTYYLFDDTGILIETRR